MEEKQKTVFEPQEHETSAQQAISDTQSEDGKGGVAIWNYQNSDEDQIRVVCFDTAPLSQMKKDGVINDEDIQKLIWMMDRTVSGIIGTFNLIPKDPNYKNFADLSESGDYKDVTTAVTGEQVKRLSDS